MIELKNITKVYELNRHDKVIALENVNLAIEEGELIVLKGASGSGKSTILSLIAALSKPTSGEVMVDKKHISKLPDNFASIYRRDNIGFIFQKYNLIPTLSVKENILLPLIPLNPHAKEAEDKIQAVMQRFHIEHKKDAMVRQLSGGEQQRVAIARANVNNPKIIIADEPTANLDEKLSEHFIEILRELKALNKTIIIATHDPLFFGLDFVDREIEIHNGKILL
ncbi:MAG: ABC transporter ATP-binding protein [Epsilonproteobacteria bacterium]|nr:ABC transporter ATP-binding protein [Campylobacterota bacterium]OIO14812.1 MAG: ABC transporter ATP-binding protein [Helicobacteraceae bacterium CG1_02_36_14]PIP10902.1 MAG: ABC transporter ATP-binding protein [Sulfurimonas sp. CG23_combo_of_CG06-09_8_20_14_all_36_33]PIS26761.1 MAG: ABC transporter ATP-binding protein [Sulfurimonas sp. CG08_land_8_20_14_0_20_36_33]PIU35079.1 MAG: ABC transporter ATP-binding protein [Sulfurimonas sp. CG07_land_8_20_14_0_80_36_56]PIV03324.1 MAG: ABC transport